MRIVLVGPPGAGKGTQAAFLAKNLSIPHVSTGDLFRANISQGTDLGNQAKAFMDAGNLVPDEVTIGMAEDRLDQADAAEGFLLDGFPRNQQQARALDAYLGQHGIKLDGVLDLEVPEDEVVTRIAGRRICRNNSAHVFHVAYKKPKTEGVCDECGGELYQRDDDTEETVHAAPGGLPPRDRADHRLLQAAESCGDDLGARSGGRGHPAGDGRPARRIANRNRYGCTGTPYGRGARTGATAVWLNEYLCKRAPTDTTVA